jgi:hypothetical protein
MQGARLGKWRWLFEDVGDVFAAVGLELMGVGPARAPLAPEFDQSHDLRVVTPVEPALLELLM